MRVTKAIREYVEQEINRKYDERELEIGKEYNARRNQLSDELEEKRKEFEDQMKKIVEDAGFEVYTRYGVSNLLTCNSNFHIAETEEQLREERNALTKRRREMIRQVLFDLEMGETAKAELKDILDNLVIE